MAGSTMPWSIKGVSLEARAAARAAAQAAGLPLGPWLSGVIRAVGAAELGATTDEPDATGPDRDRGPDQP